VLVKEFARHAKVFAYSSRYNVTLRLQREAVASTSAGGEKRDSSPAPQVVQLNAVSNGKMLGGITGKGFMPGVSGNPGGRKKKPITEIWEEIIETPEHREQVKQAAIAIINARGRNTVAMLSEMTDRIEGKPAGSAIEINADAREINVHILQVGGND
jgi:hypothetical protein